MNHYKVESIFFRIPNKRVSRWRKILTDMEHRDFGGTTLRYWSMTSSKSPMVTTVWAPTMMGCRTCARPPRLRLWTVVKFMWNIMWVSDVQMIDRYEPEAHCGDQG